MSWKFHVYKEEARVGAESAIDASDYFVDEVIEPFKILGKMFARILQMNCIMGNKKFHIDVKLNPVVSGFCGIDLIVQKFEWKVLSL